MQLQSILVALDIHDSSGLLKVASELAAKSGAELKALYVEDAEWFKASRFSFSRQISGYRGEILPFTENHITIQSRALASRFKKLFTEYSEGMRIKYSYRAVRGSTDEEMLKAASNVDLVMIKRTGGIIETRHMLGSAARNLADNTNVPVLVWNEGAQWPGTIIGICSTPEESNEVVSWLWQLANMMNLNSRLFWSDDYELTEAWVSRIVEKQSPGSALDYIKNISEIHPVKYAEDLQYYRYSMIVLQRNSFGSKISEFLNKLSHSVLLL